MAVHDSLHCLIQSMLCLWLKEHLLTFIEDKMYMLSKKHARPVLRIQRMIPKIHVFLFRLLKNTRKENGISSFKYERYIRVVATFVRLLKKSETLRLSRTQINTSTCASICNQSRLVCAYANIYDFDTQQKRTVLKKHQKIHRLLSHLYPLQYISSMLRSFC